MSPCPTPRLGGVGGQPWPPCAAGARWSLSRPSTACWNARPSGSCCRWPRRSACRFCLGADGAGVLTGEYTRGSTTSPADSRRASTNQARLTERNLRIAREVDLVADELGATSAQVAVAWLRQRDRRVIPILGVRKLEQLQDVLGSLTVGLAAEHLARLDEVSRIELGFPDELLRGPQGQMVYGDLEPQIDLPSTAPYRWRAVG